MVRSRQQVFRRPHGHNIAGKHGCSADTHGDPVSALRIAFVSKPEFLNGRPEVLGDHTGVVEIGIGKDNGQFVSAIPGSDIAGTGIPNYRGGNHPQAAIACLMAVPIIKFLKVIDI
jgi:hypothetical protein